MPEAAHTRAVRTKLKGVKHLAVTIVFAPSSPVAETMKKKVTLHSTATKRVVFQTTNIGGDATVPGGGR